MTLEFVKGFQPSGDIAQRPGERRARGEKGTMFLPCVTEEGRMIRKPFSVTSNQAKFVESLFKLHGHASLGEIAKDSGYQEFAGSVVQFYHNLLNKGVVLP